MRRISGVRKTTHKLITKVVKDHYNNANLNVAKYLMGEKIILSEEEKSDVWAIRENLKDKVYLEALNNSFI